MSQGPQKPDHRGNYFMTPRRVTDCVAWRHLSFRARAVLQVFQARHNGFNNGQIALSIEDLCAAIGDQNKGANGKAVAECIDLGFLECMSDANHHKAKARTYRLTFVSTGKGNPATHEYEDWRPAPGKNRKFGGARTALQNPVSGAVTAPQRKFSGAVTALQEAVSPGVLHPARGAVTAPLLYNHSPESFTAPVISTQGHQKPAAGISAIDLLELRDWVRAAIGALGYGGARKLAEDAGVPEPVLSRYRHGKNLPDGYRIGLQLACARILPLTKLREIAA